MLGAFSPNFFLAFLVCMMLNQNQSNPIHEHLGHSLWWIMMSGFKIFKRNPGIHAEKGHVYPFVNMCHPDSSLWKRCNIGRLWFIKESIHHLEAVSEIKWHHVFFSDLGRCKRPLVNVYRSWHLVAQNTHIFWIQRVFLSARDSYLIASAAVVYPLVNIQKNYGKSPFFMDKSTINGHVQ